MVVVGAVIAAGTLLVIDIALPGGWIEGSADLRHAQTMAFTTVVFFSLFNAFNARSDEASIAKPDLLLVFTPSGGSDRSGSCGPGTSQS